MIVNANVIDKKTNQRTFAYFLVRFDHTPVDKIKKHRRIGVCSIYYLDDKNTNIDAVGQKIEGQFFASRICGEKYKYFIVDQKTECDINDNYVKAFTRINSLKKALTWIIKYQDTEDFLKTLPFKFDNTTFKSFIRTLNEQHPHGNEIAQQLLHKHDYRISNQKNKK